jgi:hypothetical protein
MDTTYTCFQMRLSGQASSVTKAAMFFVGREKLGLLGSAGPAAN